METNDFADEPPTVTLTRDQWSADECAWSERARALASAREATAARDVANLAEYHARMAVAS